MVCPGSCPGQLALLGGRDKSLCFLRGIAGFKNNPNYNNGFSLSFHSLEATVDIYSVDRFGELRAFQIMAMFLANAISSTQRARELPNFNPHDVYFTGVGPALMGAGLFGTLHTMAHVGAIVSWEPSTEKKSGKPVDGVAYLCRRAVIKAEARHWDCLIIAEQLARETNPGVYNALGFSGVIPLSLAEAKAQGVVGVVPPPPGSRPAPSVEGSDEDSEDSSSGPHGPDTESYVLSARNSSLTVF